MAQLELIRPCVPEDKFNEIETLFNNKGLEETVLFIWESIWTDEEKQQAEKDIQKDTRNTESKYYKLLFDEFNMKEHFSQVDSHRKFVLKAYNRLKKYVPNMLLEDAEKHDLSKYTFAQTVGYTARWVHMLDNDAWKKSLDDHYKNEPHHPQYFGKGDMPDRYLEESLIDMVGSRWERNLKGDENASNTELVDFFPQYLVRYTEHDLVKVKALIEKIKLSDLVRSCVTEEKFADVETLFIEKGIVETVLHIWENIWTDEERKQAEKDVQKETRNTDSKYYKLLFIEFNMKEHFSQVDSHRKFVLKAYNRLKKYVPNMLLEDAEKHDLSKYSFAQTVGYTARWVHMLDNDAWKKSLDDHYKNEPHHPQYFGKGDMPDRYLEESLIDMVGSRWERNLKGDENAKNSELVDFFPQYLVRYTEKDLVKVKELIEKIKLSDPEQEITAKN